MGDKKGYADPMYAVEFDRAKARIAMELEDLHLIFGVQIDNIVCKWEGGEVTLLASSHTAHNHSARKP
mgnify:CR=1 FL=1